MSHRLVSRSGLSLEGVRVRFVAWAGSGPDGAPRLRVFRIAGGGMPVGDPALDRPLDDADEADEVLEACGWSRVGPWWRVPTGARATVKPQPPG